MVSAEDLEDVLEILGISTFGSSDRLSYLPVGQWISGLKLAVRWAYDGLRDTAIFYLNQNQEFCSNPVQQILYGRDYGVEQWLIDGCSHFVLRSHGPREQEAIPLGMTTTIALYDMRESMSISGFNLKAAIKSTFEDYL
ncbi:hypothetical protein CPB83DRAFT_860423 [Crepidotus variabilis]|uniref:Uncharacterized protein n=1 Tax=Crepidotus variabilis TaxID=179855 RepID=A0A9P6JLS3_9AGAR|nr:hypothetical protein CPB83DRAFT_860423 [Crepidotus variabilis]